MSCTFEWAGLEITFTGWDVRAAAGSRPVWSCELDWNPRMDAFPRPISFHRHPTHLLLVTEAEHNRGGSSHARRLHCVDQTGSYRWQLEWDLRGDVFAERDGLLVVGFHGGLWGPWADQTWGGFEVLRIGLDDGEVRERWTVPASIDIARGDFDATLEVRDAGAVVLVVDCGLTETHPVPMTGSFWCTDSGPRIR